MGIPKQILRSQNILRNLARALILCMLISIAAAAFVQPARADSTYLIRDGSEQITLVSRSADLTQVLAEAGIALGGADRFTATETETGDIFISIQRVQNLTLTCDGTTKTYVTYGGTVEQFLRSAKVVLKPEDRVNMPLSRATEDGMKITVVRVAHRTLEYDEAIPFQTLRYNDSTLTAGTTKQLNFGRDGSIHKTAYVTYEDGVETERSILSEEILSEPVNETLLIGTAPSQQTSAEGSAVPDQVVQGSAKVLQCLGTAYSCDGRPGITATQTIVHIGTVAVDPRVIPLGSKLYIVSNDGKYVYGYGTAEDTGGLIKGNRVDLYYNTTEECIQFGARGVTVYVLSEG